MRRPISYLSDLLPAWCKHRVAVVLRAFFDESGIHAGSRVTSVCGFIGSRSQWRSACRKWRAALDGQIFHYTEMRFEGQLLDRLATILCDSGLEVVSGAFTGDWERAIHSGAPDWPARFPSSYHMVLEMCAQQMAHYSAEYWHGEPIGLTFSRQDEYARRAEMLWRSYKGSGLWKHLVHFAYGDPEEFAELQMADMIAHETFQCLKQALDGGWPWDKWPLVRKLLENDRPMHGCHQTEEQFVKMMFEHELSGRRYLQIAEKPKKT
jgi:Protein of unknown function (DUF3800)